MYSECASGQLMDISIHDARGRTSEVTIANGKLLSVKTKITYHKNDLQKKIIR